MVYKFSTSQTSHSTEQKASFDQIDGRLMLVYEPETATALYDICDFEGRIIKTGKIEERKTAICDDCLDPRQVYMIWILDGDKVIKERFQLSAS